MFKGEREIGGEILDGVREIHRGDYGRVTVHASLERDFYEQAKEEAGRRGISVAELLRTRSSTAQRSQRP